MFERRLRQWLLLFFLLLLLAIPVVQLIWPVTETNENRLLAPFPEQPRSQEQLAQFPKAFESYMDDNFGFRRFLQRSFHRLMIAIGTSPLDKILLGKEGWLFTANTELTPQHRGAMTLSPLELEQYVDAFVRQRDWVEAAGAEYFLLPVPDKNTLYPEYLPDHAQQIRPSRFSQVMDALIVKDEPFVDSLTPLTAARERGEWVYWQTDSHWNCLGAFHAYNALMDAVQASGAPYRTRIQPAHLKLEARPPSLGGDMSQMLLMEDILLESQDVGCGLVLPEHISFTGERLRDGLIKRDQLAVLQTEVWRYRQAVTEIESSVLLYRDSYGHLLLPYLIKTFDEVIVVPHGELEFNEQYVIDHTPDVVIYQFVERHLLHQPDRVHLNSNQL